MSKWETFILEEINEYKTRLLNPASTPDTTYELYSVPSWSNKYPEIIKGKLIGSTKQLVEKGDVLLCKINPRINRVWIVEQYTKNPLIASLEWIVIRNKQIGSKYLSYYLQSSQFRDLLILEQSGIGGSLTRAQPKRVKLYPIPYAPSLIQQKIANVLDRTNSLIEKRKVQIEKLDLMIKSQFIEMFGDPIINPMNWEKVQLSQLGEWGRGGTPSRANSKYFEGDIDWYSAGELNSFILGRSIEKITYSAIVETSAKLFPPNSLFIGMYDTAAFKMGITQEVASANQACANVDVNSLANVYWLYHLLLAMKSHFLLQRRGIRQENLNLGMIKSFEVPLPPLQLQNQFVDFVNRVNAPKLEMQQSLSKLELNYKSLMQKCFKGEIF